MSSPSSLQNGSAWAAILAAGMGCAAFGIISCFAEVFPSLSKALNIDGPVGDLSGKSTLAIAMWIASWVLLDFRWRQRKLTRIRRIMLITAILITAGLIAVFPPVMEFVARK